MNNILTSYKIKPFDGSLTVPGDKSISHRVAILGALAEGSMVVENFLCSEDCLNTLRAMQSMGADVIPLTNDEGSEDSSPANFTLVGTGGALHAPSSGVVDCGNSGTGMRLMAGVLAAQSFSCRLVGDDSLSGRPMNRILTPLAQMGAQIEALGTKPGCAPLLIKGLTNAEPNANTSTGSNTNASTVLSPLDYVLPMASAQVKSCILLAGLFAEGETRVVQPAITRDHTERLFKHFSIDCTTSPDGLTVTLKGPQHPKARDIIIPGDISSAAFWLVAAAALPGAELTLRNVGLNPTRTAIIDVLQRMGADISTFPLTGGDSSEAGTQGEGSLGEPLGDILVKGTRLTGTSITADEVPNLIDEIPILAVAGALAEGDMILRHAHELRVKETDRITTVVTNLRAMGASVDEFEDGLVVHGGHPLHGCSLDSYGDHRIAMAFLIAGLFAEGDTVMHNTACIATSYPGFDKHLSEILTSAVE